MARRCLIFLVLLAPPLAAAQEPTYQDAIVAVFEEECVVCHDAADPSGGLDLSSYAGLMQGGASGDVVVPGDPDGSRLFRLVSGSEQPFMPDGGEPLPKKVLETLRRWIATGAPEGKQDLTQAKARALANQPKTLQPSARTLAPGALPRALPLQPVVVGPRAPSIIALAASPNAPLLAVGGHRQVLLYRPASGELLGVLPFLAGRVHRLAFSPDGATLMAAGGRGANRGEVVLWEVRSGEVLFQRGADGHAFLAADVRADRGQVAVGGPTRKIDIYATASGALEHEISKHTDWVTALAYSPDGVLLASADRGGGIHVWESLSGQEYLGLPQHPQAITALAWRGDGEVLATACEDGKLRLFELRGGKQVKVWDAHKEGVLALAFAADGRLASAGRDRHLRVWDAGGKQQRALGPLRDVGLSVVFSGELLVGGDWSGELRSWGLKNGAQRVAWEPNPGELQARVEAARGERDRAVEARRATAEAAIAAERRAKETGAAHVAAAASRARAEAAAAEVPAGEVVGRELVEALRAGRDAALRRVALLEQGGAGPGDEALLRAQEEQARIEALLLSSEDQLAAAREASAPRRAELAKAAQAAKEAEARSRAATETATAGAAKARALADQAQRELTRAESLLARWEAELALAGQVSAHEGKLTAVATAQAAAAERARALEAAQADARACAQRLAVTVTELEQAKARGARAGEVQARVQALAGELGESHGAARELLTAHTQRLEGAAPEERAAIQVELDAAKARVAQLAKLLQDTRDGLRAGEADAARRAKELAALGARRVEEEQAQTLAAKVAGARAAELEKARAVVAAEEAALAAQSTALEALQAKVVDLRGGK